MKYEVVIYKDVRDGDSFTVDNGNVHSVIDSWVSFGERKMLLLIEKDEESS